MSLSFPHVVRRRWATCRSRWLLVLAAVSFPGPLCAAWTVTPEPSPRPLAIPASGQIPGAGSAGDAGGGNSAGRRCSASGRRAGRKEPEGPGTGVRIRGCGSRHGPPPHKRSPPSSPESNDPPQERKTFRCSAERLAGVSEAAKGITCSIARLANGVTC